MTAIIPAIIPASLLASRPAEAAEIERSLRANFRIVTVASGLEQPWGMAFLPDGRMLVTEKPGRLRSISATGDISAPLSGTPQVADIGQGGLLDVALHPDFASNRLVYFSFSAGLGGSVGTEVARGRLNEAGTAIEQLRVIFRQQPKRSTGHHFGSRLVFDRSGKLFVSMGDRGAMRDAQRPGNHIGTIVRLNDDGTIPDDNPFRSRSDVRPEIYVYGVRNAQGMTLHPETGEIWETEHGPRGGDEVNILKPGANFGWPAITFGIDYGGGVISTQSAAPGMEQPFLHWTPSIAPSGMAFYSGDAFPGWRGDLFVGSLKFRHLRRVDLEDGQVVGQEELLKGRGERVRDVRVGPDGLIYVLTDEVDGNLLRLEPVE